MTSRGPKVLFAVLLLVCAAMAVWLIRLRNRAEDRLQAQGMEAPASLEDAGSNPATEVTLYVPNDMDDTLVAVHRMLALPTDENARAKDLLASLVATFHAPGSTHPMDVTHGVNGVFVMAAPASVGQTEAGGELAVVNLSGALAAAQPSGIEPESLTVLSMLATLHANLPSITKVRFLVDGHPRETLAGHMDLMRTYATAGANPTSNPQAEEGQR